MEQNKIIKTVRSTEINAYMNGYNLGDIKFLEASVQAHKDALKESKFETETAKEFLFQHIQTNKELEKKVEKLEEENSQLKDWYKQATGFDIKRSEALRTEEEHAVSNR
jgi:uncharacterized protein (DUF305 family)